MGNQINKDSSSIFQSKKAATFVILLFLVISFIADHFSNSIDPVNEVHYVAKNAQEVVSKIISRPSFWTTFLKFTSTFFFGFAATIFATIFITRYLEEVDKKKERNELEALREQINTDIFQGVFKKLIPEEIFAVVKSDIIESKTIRRDAIWNLEFIKTNEDSNDIKLIVTSTYKLHNISNQEVFDPINIDIDPISSDSVIVEEAICFDSKNKQLINFNSRTGKSDNVVIKDREGAGINISYSISIPPNDFIESTFKFSQIYRGKVFDAQSTKHPIVNLFINATFPIDYDFIVDGMFSSPMVLRTSGSTQKSFEINGGILPRQGMVFKLEKKPNYPSPPSSGNNNSEISVNKDSEEVNSNNL